MCGGCHGLGSYSSRCITQPGSLWRRAADLAEDLGDMIGANNSQLANAAYRIQAEALAKWLAAQEIHCLMTNQTKEK